MKIIFMVTAAYLIVGFLGVVPLKQDKRKKEIIIYIFIMALSLGLSIFLSTGIKYKSIATLIKELLSTFINL